MVRGGGFACWLGVGGPRGTLGTMPLAAACARVVLETAGTRRWGQALPREAAGVRSNGGPYPENCMPRPPFAKTRAHTLAAPPPPSCPCSCSAPDQRPRKDSSSSAAAKAATMKKQKWTDEVRSSRLLVACCGGGGLHAPCAPKLGIGGKGTPPPPLLPSLPHLFLPCAT
jgi:hypothetical protein